ncbi:MAG TPA: amidohydrolase family protein [Rhizomicrobium sp.]|jgi:imidazolonepropionase-like amidohydrolase|nr:amidohydrolase family protein [Rhizomicrobium sp.]
MRNWVAMGGLVLALLLPARADAPVPFAPPAKGSITIWRNATLIDGAAARPHMDIVVDGERIAEILPDRAVPAARLAGATVIDLSGKFVVPGLVDSHVHMATPPDRRMAEAMLRRDLYGGVTVVRDMADDLRLVGELTREARAGEIAAPDIFYAALMAGPSFFDDPRTAAASQGWAAGTAPWMQAIDAQTDLPLAIARARGTGATAIKVYANFPPETVARITAEAHRQHMLVWAHAAVFPARPAEVIAAGVDAVSHACYLGYQLAETMPQAYADHTPVPEGKFAAGDDPVLARMFADMKARGTILDATGSLFAMLDALHAKDPKVKTGRCSGVLTARIIGQAFRAGVAISAGTDHVGGPEAQWPEVDDEIVFLVKAAGLSPLDALTAATRTGARAAGQEGERGSLLAGKLADFVVLEKNPLADIENIRSVALTVKRGHVFRRTDYKPVTKDEVGGDE